MATMALPIRELELSVRVGMDKARAETECVVFYSRARRVSPSIGMTVKFGVYAAILKFMLSSLARHQRMLIRAYQETDFTRCSGEELARVADSLERIIEHARPVLSKLGEFGPRAQAWWGSSLSQLAEQVEHLDSIAQSLRVAADPEASLLLGLAVQRMAASA